MAVQLYLITARSTISSQVSSGVIHMVMSGCFLSSFVHLLDEKSWKHFLLLIFMTVPSNSFHNVLRVTFFIQALETD